MSTPKTQKPTDCRNYCESVSDREFFEKNKWNHLKPAGWYKLFPTERMSSVCDVVLNVNEWQKVRGLDEHFVEGFEVWRNKKLYGTVSKKLKKQAEEDRKQAEKRAEREKKQAQLEKEEAKIITKVDGDIVKFSPKMEKLIVDFGCHETKVRNLMNRLFMEFESLYSKK